MSPLDSTFSKNHIHFIKGDDALGIIYGYAMITKANGEAFVDSQGDHIPDQAMLEASADFMENTSRTLGLEHKADEGGKVIFAFPMTDAIKKAFDITTPVNGLIIGIKPKNQETYEAFKANKLTGFSIGGAAPLAGITYMDVE